MAYSQAGSCNAKPPRLVAVMQEAFGLEIAVAWKLPLAPPMVPGRMPGPTNEMADPCVYQGRVELTVELAVQIQSFNVTQAANQHASAVKRSSGFQRWYWYWAIAGYVTRSVTPVTMVSRQRNASPR